MTKAVNIKLRITETMHSELQRRAEEAERSVAAEIRLALREYLADGDAEPSAAVVA